MSPKQAKLLKEAIKFAVGAGFTALLGTIVKVGISSEDKIDAYFEEKYPQPVDKKNI